MSDWWPSGPERRAWLDRQNGRISDALSYYLGPAAAPVDALANVGAALSPGADLMDAVGYGQQTMAAETPLDALSGLGMTAAAMLGMALPGSAGRVNEATDEVLRLLKEGRVNEVTDDLLAKADPRRLYAEYDLPMDEASRMARADEMGFSRNLPLYHGTDKDFLAFDPRQGGRATGSQAAGEATWTAPDAAVAGEFPPAASRADTGHQILPLLHRAQRRGALTLDDDVMDHEVRATLQAAFDDGIDGVMMRNYRGLLPDGYDSTNILAVKDPSQLRSQFARFDPRLINLRNLLATGAVGTVGATALDALTRPPDSEERY